jgi:hypothetical protein
VKGAFFLLACGALLLPVLAACGGDSSPPFTLTCTSHRLHSGFVRATVTVSNTTDKPATAFVYGPILDRLRHIYPPLLPTYVAVAVSNSSRTYTAFVVPRVGPHKSAHLILRFEPPLPAGSILVTTKQTVQASDWTVLHNSDCHIRKTQ